MNLLLKTFLFTFLLNVFYPVWGEITKRPDSNRKVINLNGIWKFKYFPTSEIGADSLFFENNFDTKKWSDIKVPGHWDLQGFADPSEGSVPPVTGLYRTTFSLPETMKGQQIFIRFDGVQYGYDFYVNGKYVATYASSYNRADFNITDKVKFSGENTLAVKVSTRVKGYEFDTNDCWRLSGIYRSVLVYATPNFHLDDYTVQTTLTDNNKTAAIDVALHFQDAEAEGYSGLVLKAVLHSSDGKSIGTCNLPVHALDDHISFKIKNPLLWTAETPSLYKLELVLIRENNILDRITQQVGIRQVKIENAVLKLNGSPLKLRGVDHHDLVPGTGRTLIREDILKDLKMIQRANANFVRTSHYPPDPRMLDMCDSLGIYVMCEVPFGGGDDHLTDPSYEGMLLKRAEATLWRDKNHPCVIFWSIGNENPLTPITEVVGKYVQQTDPTRPICYPQMGSYFKANYKSFPDFLDLYTPHYLDAEWIREYQKETTKPVILTEYAHALGLLFGNLEDIWAELFRNNHFAGGAVWHFHDQGIIRKSSEPVDRFKPTVFVWKDSVTYYDTRKIHGIDGIVYSDRTLQTDYRQVQKVYSPIQIIERKLAVIPGKQTLNISIYNQYDFLNLSVLQGKWSLYQNREIAQKGKFNLNCAPHDTISYRLPITLPEAPELDVWYLKFDFQDKNNESVYSHTIELKPPGGLIKLQNEILKGENASQLSVKKVHDGSSVSCNGFNYKFSNKDLSLRISDHTEVLGFISGGLYAHTGRALKIGDTNTKSEAEEMYWEPYSLVASDVNKTNEVSTPSGYKFSADAIFPRGYKFPDQKLKGHVDYAVSSDGVLTVEYSWKPENATGFFLEAGVSFMLSEKMTDFMWLGDGPYASYPDKYMLSDFGSHYLKKGDLYFNGNRTNVHIAVLTDPQGNGIAILADGANIAVELNNGHIVVSHNAKLMGVGNKATLARIKLDGNNLGEIRGSFRIIPLRANQWPVKLVEVIGKNNPSIRPFQPFYHSYNFTW
ncbi:MAG: glycoside hydrolase family 2 TIM barrel-domain containing protein [Mangrovibacterium sp.]